MDCEGKPGETAGPAAITREILGKPKKKLFFYSPGYTPSLSFAFT